MSKKFTKPILAISILVSLVTMSVPANAGATISDKRYWPSEVGPSAYPAARPALAARDAFASFDRRRAPSMAH